MPDRLVKGNALDDVKGDAGRIDETAGDEEPEIHCRHGKRKRPDHRDDHPAHAEIEREARRLETAREYHLERDAEAGAEPNRDEDDRTRKPSEPVRHQRRVSPGDHDEDGGMVEPAQDFLGGPVVRPQIIGRRGEDHGQQAGAINRHARDNRGRSRDMREQPCGRIDREQDAQDVHRRVGAVLDLGIDALGFFDNRHDGSGQVELH